MLKCPLFIQHSTLNIQHSSWCERGDSNPHGCGPLDPKSSASTSSATLAKKQLSVVSSQFSVVSSQLSVVSRQLSVVSCQLSVVSCQLSVVRLAPTTLFDN